MTDSHRHRPRRRFGQNFLADAEAARRIVEALAVRDGDAVLEIGPGRGALTAPLLEAGARVVAAEIDRDLAADLAGRFRGARLEVVTGDVLDLDLGALAARLGAPLAVAGNLPYNISKPVARRLVRERAAVTRAVLMFQREVAERLTAGPGGKEYGPLSVLAGTAYDIERMFDLGPGAFRPRPKVTSTVTRWRPREGGLDPALERRLERCLAAVFARRRRTILNNLRAALHGGDEEARRLLEAVAVDPGARAEAVPRATLVEMAKRWPDESA